MKIIWPRGETPTHWIVMGLNPKLDEAMKIYAARRLKNCTWRSRFTASARVL